MTRQLRARALACLLVLTAGCAAPFASPAEPTQPTRNGSTTGPGTPTTETCDRHRLTAELAVEIAPATKVRITLENTENGTVVVNRTVTGPAHVMYGDGDVLQARTPYRAVVGVNGSVAWERTIQPYEFAQPTVLQSGNVTGKELGVKESPTPC